MLLANEFRYLFRQPVFLLSLILVPLVGYIFAAGLTSDAPSFAQKLQLKYMAMIMIALPTYMGLLLPLFFSRDQNHNMTELIGATSVPWQHRVMARLFAFFNASVGVFVICFILIMTVAIGQESESLMIQDLVSGLVYFVGVILIPSVALYTVLGYLLSAHGVSAFTFYGLAMIIFVGYLLAASLSGNPILAGSTIISESFHQTMLWLDPYGLTALIVDLNSPIIESALNESASSESVISGSAVISDSVVAQSKVNYSSVFWINRVSVLLFIALALLSHFGRLTFLCKFNHFLIVPISRSFQFARRIKFFNRFALVKSEAKGRSAADKGRSAADNHKSSAILTSADFTSSILFKYDWLELAYRHFMQIVTNRITLLILIGWPLMIFSEVFSGINYVEPMSIKLPNSLDAINRINDDILPFFGYLLIALWSWQIVGASKSAGFHELLAATNVKNTSIIGAQLLTLTALIFILSLLTIVGCLTAETLAGGAISNIQISVYLAEFSLIGLTLNLLGAIFIAIQHISKSRAVGTGILLLLLTFKFTPISGAFGVTHTLWNIASSPLQQADHFWQRAGSLSVYMPYMTFWVLVSLTLLVIAISFSHRGTLFDSIPFKKLGRYIVNLPIKKSSTSAVLFIATVLYGLNLHQQMSIEKPLTFSVDRETWKANYEKSFSHWLAIPQPTIVHMDANIDVYPAREYANFTMTYKLKNKTDQPIDQILVGRFGNFAQPTMASTQKDLELKINNAGFNQSVISLSEPLVPGEHFAITMTFDLQQPKLWPATSQFYIKPQMTYLRGVPLLPVIGYQPDWALRNNQLREEYGLEPMSHLLPSERFSHQPYQLAYSRQLRYDWVTYNTRITTAADHHAIAPGKLISSTTANDRTTFVYESSVPMRPIPSWFSMPQSTMDASAKSTVNIAGKTQPIDIEIVVPNHVNAANTHAVTSPKSNTRPNVYTPAKIRAEGIAVNMQAVRDSLKWLSENVSPYRHDQLRLFATPNLGATGLALPQHMLIEHEVGFKAIPNNDNGLTEVGFDQRYRRAVHETAHQWFGHDIGNGIVEDSAFLVESLAKYIELVMIEKHFGLKTKEALVAYEQKRYDNAQRFYLETPRSLIDATSSHQQYSQATLVFDKLRNTLGDKMIIDSLKVLWQEYGYPKKPATSVDFIRILKDKTDEKNHELIEKLFLKA